MPHRPAVLVVDDEPINLAIMEEALSDFYEVRLASSGAEALDLLTHKNVDVILLDVMMPERDGYAVCQAIKENPRTKDIPVLFVTAKHDPESEIRGIRLGAADFIQKPVNIAVILARIQLQIELAQHRNHLDELLAERTRDLAEAKAIAEDSSQIKAEFISSMHHELKTPLNAILGFAQLIEMEALSDEVREYLSEILQAGHKMFDLISQMLEFSSIDPKEDSVSFVPCQVSDVLNESLDLVDYKAQKLGVTISRQTSVCEEVTILTDHDRFRLILVNLLSNAIKFNRPQGKVIISCEQRGSGVCISVQDTGMGIPAAMRDRVFKPFDRLGREGGNIDGLGIGLAIAKRSVESLGGTIDFESVEGEGTTFKVVLG